MLSILDGLRRYAHVAGLRGDAVTPQILGMTKNFGDESLRRELHHVAPSLDKPGSDDERCQRESQLAKSTAQMDSAVKDSHREALTTGWILDTIKFIYGHQDIVAER